MIKQRMSVKILVSEIETRIEKMNGELEAMDLSVSTGQRDLAVLRSKIQTLSEIVDWRHTKGD
jgi:predicted  nucleic acid-binding Zn-ribbon protein